MPYREGGKAKKSGGRRTVERQRSHCSTDVAYARLELLDELHVDLRDHFWCVRRPFSTESYFLRRRLVRPDILQMRVPSKELNDTKKYGTYGERFFFLMRREKNPVEAVSAKAREH